MTEPRPEPDPGPGTAPAGDPDGDRDPGHDREHEQARVAVLLSEAGCVFADEEAGLLVEAAAGPTDLAARLARRVSGEPLEHILGWVDFDGSHLFVGPGAFVPRQRSVLVAQLAVEEARRRPSCLVLEICCGVAPIGALVARDVELARVMASDSEPVSLQYARRNLPTSEVYLSDLFASLPREAVGRVGVLAAVPPYVPDTAAGQLPRDARTSEPADALYGGPDGLDVVRAILLDAGEWLDGTGVVLMEMHRSQVATASTEASICGLSADVVRHPDGHTTVLRCRARPTA